ncbi:MAG: hypothetical protein ACE5LU_11835, partial [Anaerolineae bacterium]
MTNTTTDPQPFDKALQQAPFDKLRTTLRQAQEGPQDAAPRQAQDEAQDEPVDEAPFDKLRTTLQQAQDEPVDKAL